MKHIVITCTEELHSRSPMFHHNFTGLQNMCKMRILKDLTKHKWYYPNVISKLSPAMRCKIDLMLMRILPSAFFFCFPLFFFFNETIPLYPQMLPQDRAQVTVTSTWRKAVNLFFLSIQNADLIYIYSAYKSMQNMYLQSI